MSIRFIPRNSIGKSYRFHSFYIEFIGFTYGIPRYITDRQNYIGFTYKSPITYLFLFTVHRNLSFLATKSLEFFAKWKSLKFHANYKGFDSNLILENARNSSLPLEKWIFFSLFLAVHLDPLIWKNRDPVLLKAFGIE